MWLVQVPFAFVLLTLILSLCGMAFPVLISEILTLPLVCMTLDVPRIVMAQNSVTAPPATSKSPTQALVYMQLTISMPFMTLLSVTALALHAVIFTILALCAYPTLVPLSSMTALRGALVAVCMSIGVDTCPVSTAPFSLRQSWILAFFGLPRGFSSAVSCASW